MITDMRDSISSWPVRICMILLIISFAGFFGWGRGQQGLKVGEVARVNGDPIQSRDFSFRYQNLIQSYQRQGTLPENTSESIYNLLKEQLLNSMIFQKLKAHEAKKLHLYASDEKTKETIKKQFSDSSGKFDFKFYDNFLRNQMGKSPGQYEQEERESQQAELFEKFVLETGLASNLQLKQSYELNNEKISLSFVKINAKNSADVLPKGKAPTDDQVKKFYDEHPELFKTKEKRKLDIAYFDKKDFSKSKDFEKEAQTILQNETDANKDSRLKHVQTGLIGYEDTAPPLNSTELTEVLNSTINLEQGKSTVLVSRDGGKVYLTKLIELQASTLPPLSSVKNDVIQAYQNDQNKLAFAGWAENTWKDIVNGKQSIEQLASRGKLKVEHTDEFAYTKTDTIPAIGSYSNLMNIVFGLSLEKPYPSEPIKIGDDFVFLKLKSKTTPDWKKFESDKDNLTNALLQQTAQTRFSEWMDYIEKNSVVKRELQVSQSAGVPAY